MRWPAAFFLALAIVLPAATQAHIVREAPWNPLAHGYRQALFLLNQDPVPWDAVSRAFATVGRDAASDATAYDELEQLDAALGSDHAARIRDAIAQQVPQALYAAATRALAAGIRYRLDRAATRLDDPAAARLEVDRARSLYRAFEDFVQEKMPATARELGRAWLRLASATGAAGIGDTGRLDADPRGFADARQTIERFVRSNYQPDRFAGRQQYAPLPETHVRETGDSEVAPWLPPGSRILDPDPLPLLILNFEEQGIDETELPMVAYGDMLFDSPELFGDPARSLDLTCSSCHPRSDVNREFFIPGVSHQAGAADVDSEYFNRLFNDHRGDSLDIPSLRGLRFTAPYGRDGRFESLRDFVRNVIVNEFGGEEPTPFMLDSMIAYLLEFDFLPNRKIDSQGRLTDHASEAAHRGEALFNRSFEQMGGRACASCHVPSANFVDGRSHNIGSGDPEYADSRGNAYDTPTLLGARFTDPYFHDGSLPTLASVVEWFDDNHGLGLDARQRADLIAYLEAVGDANQPYEEFDGRHTRFRLAWEELTTFASTLDVLLPKHDAHHARLLIDTVAPDLAADASDMQNRAARGQVYELAEILRGVGDAIERDDWAEAERLWARFKTKQDEYDARMY